MEPNKTHRGVSIYRTSEYIGFTVGSAHAFCICVRERAEDSAPIIDTFSSVDEARAAIDEELDERAVLIAQNA